MENIKLVIFDLDGTLINAYPAITRSFNYVMRKVGSKIQTPLTIRRTVGTGDRNLLKPFVKIEDLDKALLEYRLHHRQSLVKDSKVFKGVYQVLEYLKKKKYKLAVASNRPTEFSLILLRHLKLKKYFDYVLCADKLTIGKPHPEILNKIMRKFKARPQETVYVGDMVIDAQAGSRAKVNTVIVTTGSSGIRQIKAENPDYMIKNIKKLLKII